MCGICGVVFASGSVEPERFGEYIDYVEAFLTRLMQGVGA